MIRDPMYAAIIAAIITFFAKWADNRMTQTKGTILGYLKSMAYSASLVGLWVYVVGGAASGSSVRSAVQSPAPSAGLAGFAGTENIIPNGLPRRMTQPSYGF